MKTRGEDVAMVGLNGSDREGMVYADLSIGLSTFSTEEARNASQMLILDDSFGSIVKSFNHVTHKIRSSSRH